MKMIEYKHICMLGHRTGIGGKEPEMNGTKRHGSRVLLGIAVTVAMAMSGTVSSAYADTDSTDGTAPLFTAGTYPRVDGSTVTQPLGVAFQSLFTGQDVASTDVVFNQTHQAYLNLIDGDADLILVTSPSQDELDAAQAAGVDLEVIPVVGEGFVFLTNADNPVDSLTLDQVRAIYSGQITNWKDVGGPDQAITAYQRPENSGSQTGMLDLVMGNTSMMVAPTLWTVGSMGALVDAIAATFDGSEGSLGYSYYYYVTQMYGDLAVNPQLSKIKLMSIDGVNPSAETIRSGEYPLHTAYYIVINGASAPDSPARILANAMLSHDGQQTAMETGYVPVDESIPLPTPPAPDPNGLTSLDETYAVNPLSFAYSTENLMGTQGCTPVSRVTVSGLTDTALQDQINARFRALQDSVGGFSADSETCDVPQYNRTMVSAVVGANFSNVLSLQTELLVPRGLAGIPTPVASDALNVRLDTGEDLTPADVFTTTANVPGMIALEAQAADITCDEACANAKANQYRDDPDQPFSFTAQSATIAGVDIPFTSYWPQVAIFNKYASEAVLYTASSPASCTVVSARWDTTLNACVPVSVRIANFGEYEVQSDTDTVSVHIPATANESWEMTDMMCSSVLNGSSFYPSLTSGIRTDDGKLGLGIGPADVVLPLIRSTSSSLRSSVLCVQAIDQNTRMARYGEITVLQDAVPATWILSLDPSLATVPTGSPTVSGTLTMADGTPVEGAYVDVSVPGVYYNYTSPGCTATTAPDGTWSCDIAPALTSGIHQIQAQTSCSGGSDQCEWGTVVAPITVLADSPQMPSITTPSMGQIIYTSPQPYIGVSTALWFTVGGTAQPGATVTVYGSSIGDSNVTADGNGRWSILEYMSGTGGSTTIMADATVDGTKSEATSVTFTVSPDASYVVQVPEAGEIVDVTLRVVNPKGQPSVTPNGAYATVTAADPVHILTPLVRFGDDGTAVMRFSSDEAGSFPVQFFVSNQPVPISADGAVPTTLTFSSACPSDVCSLPPAPTFSQADDQVISGHADKASATSNDIARVDVTYLTVRNTQSAIPVDIDSNGDWSLPTPKDIASGFIFAQSVTTGGIASPAASTYLALPPTASPVVLVADMLQISGTAAPDSLIQISGVVNADITADNNGDWLIFTPLGTEPGEITVTATILGRSQSAPTSAMIAAPNPVTVSLTDQYAINLQMGSIASTGSVVASAVDASGTPVDGVSVTFVPEGLAVSLGSTSCVTGAGGWQVMDMAFPPESGMCGVTYSAVEPGTAIVRAYSSDAEIAGSPVTIIVSAAMAPPSPTVTTANGTVISGHADSTPGSALANDIVRVEVTYATTDGTKTVTAEVGPIGDWSVQTPSDAVDGRISVVSVNVAGVVSAPTTATLEQTPTPTPVSSTPPVPPTSSTPPVPPTSSTPPVPPTSSTPPVPPTSSIPPVPPVSSTPPVPPVSPTSATPSIYPVTSVPTVPPVTPTVGSTIAVSTGGTSSPAAGLIPIALVLVTVGILLKYGSSRRTRG